MAAGRIRDRLRRLIAVRASGATLVEVTIAVVVLGLLTAAVPPVMMMMTRSEFTRNEHRVAEYITRSQMELVKSRPYIAANATAPEPNYGTIPVPNTTYEIDLDIQPVRVDEDTRAHEPLPDGEDEGIQEVTVTVYHAERLVLATRGYEVDR